MSKSTQLKQIDTHRYELWIRNALAGYVVLKQPGISAGRVLPYWWYFQNPKGEDIGYREEKRTAIRALNKWHKEKSCTTSP